jgi:PAS domain S-box-containing protein
MESQGRSPYPISPHQGDGKPATWLATHAATIAVASILFAVILGGAIALGYQHMTTTTQAVLTGDKTTASLFAIFVEEHNKATLGILQSYANRPRFITAVKNKDTAEAGRHLATLQSRSNIDLTFVTDPHGILWINSPYFPEALGKDLSSRDWYKGISSQWQPYVSSVFKLIVADKPLAVAMSVPVHDEQEKIIGILSSSQRLDFLKKTVESLPLSPDSPISVIDQTGHMLYSNIYPHREQLTTHPLSSNIFKATQENTLQLTLATEQQDRDRLYLTVAPVGGSGWSVIVERSAKDILRAERRHFFELGGFALLVYTLVILFLAFLRKITLFKKTEKLLQTEQELRALSARHEAILSAVPEIIMEVDTNKVYTWANSVGREFFGDDVLGKEASYYFEGEQDTYDKISPLFRGSEEKIYVESWQRRRDGEIRLLAWWCRILKDVRGNITGGLSSAYDITEQKSAEEKFKHIFNSSVTGISITLPSGEVEVNRAFATMLGYEENELKNVRWHDFSHPDDTEATRQAIGPVLEGKTASARFTKRYLHKNGSIVWADVGTSLRRDKDGKPLYFVTSVNDVTERKQMDDTLRLKNFVFDASIAANSIADTKGNIIEANDAFERIWGYPPGEAIGKPIPHFFNDPREAVAILSVLNDAGSWEGEFVAKRKDGSTFTAQSTATVIKDRMDKLLGYQSSVFDVTEQKQAEEKLLLYAEELARSNTDLQQFAYVASHDLQEPLRMVSSYLELIERRYKDRLDDDTNTFIHYAVDGANRMQALIVGLLEFSRIKTHGQVFASVDVTAVLQGVCRNLHAQIVESEAVVHYEEMPVIQGDESQISRLFQNLLQNALKFRRDGIPPVVDIRTENTDTGQIFSVHDNGIGIESQYYERIFNMFQRLHTREAYPGTGIGLAICKRIVERHGGKIWLESTAGAGTSFYFSIPGERA